MLGKTLDGEFKLLCIRELDNDDVDVKPDSTYEDSPPILHTSALANELWCSVERTLVALDEIQVNVMQKSVVYWKWPNVVDIYCKRTDAIKRTCLISLPQVPIVVGSCFKQFKFKESM